MNRWKHEAPQVVAKLPLTVQQGNYLMGVLGHARSVDVEAFLENTEPTLNICKIAVVLHDDTGANTTARISVANYYRYLQEAVV